MTKRTATTSALAIVLAMLLAACDKVPLIAPSGSAITLSANSTTVPTNGVPRSPTTRPGTASTFG